MVYKSGQIFLPFCHNTRVWQTDGWTDRRTDRRTDRNLITIPRLHYMQRGKNWRKAFLAFHSIPQHPITLTTCNKHCELCAVKLSRPRCKLREGNGRKESKCPQGECPGWICLGNLSRDPYLHVCLTVICSDRTIRPPLFWDQISNCTNLLRPEPNRTRHRIFAIVSLLFCNL